MKLKTSITLSDDLLRALDRMAGPGRSRSAFIEDILRSFVQWRERERRLAGRTPEACAAATCIAFGVLRVTQSQPARSLS